MFMDLCLRKLFPPYAKRFLFKCLLGLAEALNDYQNWEEKNPNIFLDF